MKKLLTTITLSALVGTSASSLQPVFTNSVVSHRFKSNQVSNKDISIENQNSSNPFIPKQLPSLNEQGIGAFAVDYSGDIYAGTSDGLYKSTDGINFEQVNDKLNASVNDIAIQNTTIYLSTNNDGLWKSNDKGTFYKINESPNNIMFNSLVVTSNNVLYIGTYKGNGGIWTINLIEQLIKINKPDTFDESWPLYNGIVYNSAQKIDIKEKLVAKATLDGSSITIPTKDLTISIGEHILFLTLKDKSLASIFGGDTNTGQVVYKLWVKTSINKNKIDYQTKIDDTQLYTGLVSNSGNTNNADIVQTKIKDETGTHDASFNIDFKDIFIDFDVNKSFYEQGAIDETTNNFTATGSKQVVSKNLSIQNDGIYHLHLEDTVGNKYESYLELGESNWKLTGTFDDKNLTELANKLNVTVNESNPIKKTEAMGWLQNYKIEADKQFRNVVQTNGKGFDISLIMI